MPTTTPPRRPPWRTAAILRPHRRRCLEAPDLRRARQQHPRHRARRPRRNARHAAKLAARLTCKALRILDAGCGTGALAVEAAKRGAHVVAIDLSPTLVELARERLPHSLGKGRIEFHVGDMLDPTLGRFDHVVAMDSLIHYRAPDITRVLASLAERTERSILFTFAPRTLMLSAMWGVGRMFPRGDRAPAIEPVTDRRPSPATCGQRRDRLRRPPHPSRQPWLLHFPGPGSGASVSAIGTKLARNWTRVGTRFLPFADAATARSCH